jgi:hypothetical protein
MQRATSAIPGGTVESFPVGGEEELLRRQRVVRQWDLEDLAARCTFPKNHQVLAVAGSSEKLAILGERHGVHGTGVTEAHGSEPSNRPPGQRIAVEVNSTDQGPGCGEDHRG